MAGISSTTSQLLNSQLSTMQMQQEASMKVARKTLDAAEMQGQAAVALIDAAAEMGQQMTGPSLTMGAVVSGLGQNLDISA